LQKDASQLVRQTAELMSQLLHEPASFERFGRLRARTLAELTDPDAARKRLARRYKYELIDKMIADPDLADFID
jgi:hypothetical protein